MSTLERAACPSCGKVLAIQPPKGGDGTVDVFPRHRDTRGEFCEDSRQIVQKRSYQ